MCRRRHDHWSHPAGRQASLVIVSTTTPAETFLAWVTTATCLPQDGGQYHLMWLPLDVVAFAVLPCAAVGQERPRGLDRADGFPYVGSAGQGRASAGGACAERDAGVLAHPEGFIHEPVRGRGQGHAGVGGCERCQPLGYGSVEPYRCR